MVQRFREFELDQGKRLLTRRGEPVDVGQRTLDALIYLIANRDRVVSKEELREEVWNSRPVGSSAIPTAINALRKALSDPANEPELIQTVYGHGYRWIGTVVESDAEPLRHRRSRERRFFGRESELQQAQALFERAEGEGPIATLFVGEPGIGKSRVLEEVSGLAERRGFRAVAGCCAEVAGASSLGPWKEITGRLGLSALSDLVASLQSRANDSAESAGAARFELLEEMSRQLAMEVGRGGELVLLFDDLHRADIPSLLLLQGMVKTIRPAGVRFVGALRPHPLSAKQREIVNSLASSRSVLFADLAGLKVGETGDLVRLAVEAEIGEEIVQAIFDRSGGNPLYIEQLVRQLNAADDGDAKLASLRSVRTSVALTRIIEAEFERIDGQAMRVLQAGAVLGREFDLGLSARLSGFSEDETLECLGGEEVAYLAREISPGRFRFRHVLHRDAVYEAIEPAARARMHRAALDGLNELHGKLVGEVACIAAPHAVALPSTEEAPETIRILEAAAAWSERCLGFEEAVSYLRNALDVVERSGSCSPRTRAELYVRLGGAERRSGDPVSASETFRKGAELARLAEAPDVFARAALGFAPGFFAIEAGVVDAQLIEMLEQALQMLPRSEHDLRARVTGRLAMALYWSEHSGDCQRLGDEAVAIASQPGSEGAVAFAATAREVSRWGPKGAAERAALSEWAIGLAESAGDRETELVYRLYRITSLLQLGEFETAWKDQEVFLWRALASLHGGALWYADLLSALRAMMAGEWKVAERLAADFVRQGKQVRDRNAENCAVIHESYREIEYGSEAEARRLVDAQAELFPRVRSYECGRIYLSAAVGDVDEARRRLRRLVTPSELRLPETVEWMIGAALLAEACHVLRDKKRARVILDQLAPYEDEYVVVVFSVAVWRPVSYFLARVADTVGQHEEADRLFEKARAQSVEHGAAPWEAHVLFGHAELLRRRAWPGDGIKARSLAQQARTIAERLSMAPLLRRVNGFLWGPGGSAATT